jgi:hypothetical protein
VVVGVTGHRHLRPADRPALEARVREFLADLLRRYPHTPLVVLSALAEGADRLAARVALDLGVRLVVPLPLPPALYEQDFKTPESLAEFRGLLQQAASVVELPLVPGNAEADVRLPGAARNRQYAGVGAYLARHSQILIALWDGLPSDKVGGTVQVVRFQLQGVPEPFGPPRSPLDPADGGLVYHVVTPRESGLAPAGDPLSVRVLFPPGHTTEPAAEAAYRRVFARMDTFNRDALRLPRPAERESGAARAFAGEGAEALPADLLPMLAGYAAADALALHFRRRTLWTLRGLILLAWATAALFEAYSHLPSKPPALAVLYVATLVAAYGWHLWARRGDFDNKYLDYRAVAEGLRVQLFWRLAGVEDLAADHYLRKQRGELEWIRHAVRVWDLAGAGPAGPAPPPLERLRLVLARWVVPEADYYTRTARRDHARSRLVRRAGYAFFLAGLVLAVIKVFLDPENPLLLATGLALVVAALLHVYAQNRGFAEHAKQYGRMSLLFGAARQRLQESIDQGRPADGLALVRELGRESLAENGEWVLLHRERPLEVPRA